MLTQCPLCDTFFRLSAPQLRAARGMVRCGECDEVFNALDFLHEHIPPSYKPPVLQAGTQPSEDTDDQTDADSPIEDGELEVTEPDLGDDVETDYEDETEPEESLELEDEKASLGEEPDGEIPPVETNISLDDFIQEEPQQLTLETDVQEQETDPTDPMDILIEPPSSTSEDVMAEKLNLADLDDLPEALREEIEADADTQGSVLGIVLWSVAIFLLLVGLAVQLSVSFQNEIEERLPASKAVYEKICVHLPCQTVLYQNPIAIKMVARDVRHHPRFRNTLLVNGTLVNESEQTVSFPVLQFELLDSTGTVIGVRQFQPAEYLDKSIDLDEGMPPGRPVHIVMEVLGASESAVSFEFSFL